jgi:putative membrane-bound dehydrogenase-like protein
MPRRLAACLTLALALLPAPALRGQEDDLARELPRIKPLEPEAALKSFKIRPGFRLELAAAEPMVTSPVAACYDADGRLYVVEMRGYPFPEKAPGGRVRRLEDSDGDGRFDKATTFLDALPWPTSVVPYDGGIFIAAAPEIIYAKDSDGDGVADVRKVMFTGFGTQNVQALVNGLLWGPDGWIYGVGGGNGGEIKDLSHPDRKPVSIRGRDFRFKPDGSAFEAATGGGQFGHSFDDWGHRFTCNNSDNIRQIVLPADALARNPHYSPPSLVTSIAVDGPAARVFRISAPEPWRVVRTRQRVANPDFVKRAIPSELLAAGYFTSATGVTIYRGSAFPPAYRGNAFIGDVGGNLVHRKSLEAVGSTYLARRADEGVEFLASTDNWFRPVNFANTPGGTLLVLDMYRETIEHPESIPEPIKRHLDLTSGRDRGRIYEVVPAEWYRKRRRPALEGAKPAELVALLADPDAWWRETAQRLLVERKDPAALPLLREAARRRPTALARLHALWTLDALGTLQGEDLRPALVDPEPGVREQAARLAGPRAAGDRDLRRGLSDLARDDSGMVRFQAALALAGVDDPQAALDLAAIGARDPADTPVGPGTRAAILCAAEGRAVPILEALAASGPRVGGLVEGLAAQVGAEGRPADIRALLAKFAGRGADPTLARTVVMGLGKGLRRSGGSLRGALDGPTAESLRSMFDEARRVASGTGLPSERIAAIELLGAGPAEGALELFASLLDVRQPASVQLAALQAMANLPDRRVGPAIVARWKGLGPALRREATEALLARRDRVVALLDAVEARTIAPNDLDPARRRQLLAQGDAALRDRAKALLGSEPKSDRSAVIASYRKALDLVGDSARGREVFRKHCATCHKAEGVGTDVGPALATITGRTPQDLLIHILDPNREVAPPYVNYNVATTDGQVLTGLIATETTGGVTLKRAEGATDVVPRDRIESLASTGLSLMPEGLEKEVSPEAMADLLAYLRGLRASSPPAPGR